MSSPAFLFLLALTGFYLFLAAVIFLRILWGPALQGNTRSDESHASTGLAPAGPSGAGSGRPAR